MLRLATILLVPLAALAEERPYVDPVYTQKERSHWSFVPPKRTDLPKCDAINPVDAFIGAKLNERGLKPSPEADNRTLIRRLTYDLHGLPPTPGEMEAFDKDTSANAYETLVDRLLASPHFGERQAQHWLDVVRFAESNGYEADRERSNAWRYRDYVVRSFNADKPYDRFLTEQIAGELLAEGKPAAEAAELQIATGLQRCGPIHMTVGNAEKEELRQEMLMEMVNGLGAAALGVTLACARCHDHKFDPISQGDYYRFQAFFSGAVYAEVEFATVEERKAFREKNAAIQDQIAPLKQKIAELEAPIRAKLLDDKKAKLPEATRKALQLTILQRTAEQRKLADDAKPLLKIVWDEVLAAMPEADRDLRARWKAEQAELEARLPEPLPTAWSIKEEKPAPTYVLNRGDVKRKRSIVEPGFFQILSKPGEVPKNRLDLAKWITSPENPLTARVMVNRIWQHHFGRGLVNTPNDFGTRGDPPSHPELLDWLAMELVAPTKGEPWTMKRIHKLIVMSSTYKQRSDIPLSPEAAKLDPENKLLWKMNPRRLEAEAIRDAILTVAGTLNREVSGPSVKVPLEKEVYDLIFTEDEPTGMWRVIPDAKQHTRRSLYLFAKRNVRQPLLEAFDQPDTLGSCAVRGRSTFAPQALILMNGPLSHEQSRRMADSVMKAAPREKWLEVSYLRAFGRPPRAEEEKAMEAFMQAQAGRYPKESAEREAFADTCKAVFNLSEFIWVK